jgi:glutaredoxin 3
MQLMPYPVTPGAPYNPRWSVEHGAVMAKVEMYSTVWCPYCARARALLHSKGVPFTDIDIEEEPARRAEMVRRAHGRTSVPQIFIDGQHIGGSDELVALDRAGTLDAQLGIAA